MSEAFFPVDEDIGSDSALLDNVVELLLAAGTRDLAEVIMMVIPEAWQNTWPGVLFDYINYIILYYILYYIFYYMSLDMPRTLMQKEKKDFYKYLSCASWLQKGLKRRR